MVRDRNESLKMTRYARGPEKQSDLAALAERMGGERVTCPKARDPAIYSPGAKVILKVLFSRQHCWPQSQ